MLLFVNVPRVRDPVASTPEELFARRDAPARSCFAYRTYLERSLYPGITPGLVGLDGILACVWTPDPAAGLFGSPRGPSDGLHDSILPEEWTLDAVARPIIPSTFADRTGGVLAGKRCVLIAAAERHHGRMALVHTSLFGSNGRWTGCAPASAREADSRG